MSKGVQVYNDEILKILRGTAHSVRIPDLMESVSKRIAALPDIAFDEDDFIDALDDMLDQHTLELNWRNRVELVKEVGCR
jgi:hypothetical protein